MATFKVTGSNGHFPDNGKVDIGESRDREIIVVGSMPPRTQDYCHSMSKVDSRVMHSPVLTFSRKKKEENDSTRLRFYWQALRLSRSFTRRECGKCGDNWLENKKKLYDKFRVVMIW